MTWKIEFTVQAAKQFNKLDKPIQQRISTFLTSRLAKLDDPRQLGKQLQGPVVRILVIQSRRLPLIGSI